MAESEHEALRATIRAYLADTAPISAVRARAVAGGGFDRLHWKRTADEVGLPALAVPSAYGGDGAGLPDLVVVMAELGRALYLGPYFSSVVLSGSLLVAASDEQAMAELLPGVADGSRLITVAGQERAGGWDPYRVTTTAARRDGGWRIEGQKCFVVDAASADVILLLARTGPAAAGPESLSLFRVNADDRRVAVRSLPALDLTRPQGEVTFDGAPAELVGDEGGGWAAVRTALDFAGVALAAEQAAGARRCLELAVEYAKIRTAFGGVIGGYQAIKHLCADMWVLVSGSEAAVSTAAQRHALAADDFAVAAKIARVYCSDAYVRVAGDAIHVHGGIGFTWEHDAHLYLRRAHGDATLLESADELRDQILIELGL